MFRLQRANNKPSKSGERIDFKFSNFQALQVPKGWDKLLVSIISVETGKATSKSGKAIVRNGNCQWTETLSESIWISQDDSSKELQECLFKLVVSMGSSRSGILGEAKINMVQYASSKVSSSVSLPLKKCNYGTILQLKIHCLTPRTKLRNEESANSHSENENADSKDVDSKSNGFYDSFARSSGFPARQDLDSTSHPGKSDANGTNYLTSNSINSFGSLDGSGREIFLLKNEVNGDKFNLGGTHAGAVSENSSRNGNSPVGDHSTSSHLSFNSRITGSEHDMPNNGQDFEQSSSVVIATSSLTNVSSSKSLLEAAEETIEELRKESKKWEREAQKLMLDLDILKKECYGQTKRQTDLEMELSAAYVERHSLKQEIDQLKLMLDETMVKQTTKGEITLQSEGVLYIQKELESEIKFHQESNANLALQLRRSQESNAELVSVLQELEETIEKQKVEIDNLTAQNSKYYNMEESIEKENRDLLQQLQESERPLQLKLQLLEQALEEKTNQLENEQNTNYQSLLDIEKEHKYKISENEEHIARLEVQLMESLKGSYLREMESTTDSNANLIREIETLKDKVQELEKDCNELTDENLDLLFKLKELNNSQLRVCASDDCGLPSLPANSKYEVNELGSKNNHVEKELKRNLTDGDQPAALETSTLLLELLKQFELCFHHVKKPWYNISFDVNNEDQSYLDNLVNVSKKDMVTLEVLVGSCFSFVVELNKLLEAKISRCEEVLQHGEVEIKEKNNTVAVALKRLESDNLKILELESSNIDLEARFTDLRKEMADKRSEEEKLAAKLLSKDQEIDYLRLRQRELEAEVSNLQKDKDKLQENIEVKLKESNISSKCLADLHDNLMVLKSNLDSHVSEKETLEKKLADLESGKCKLQLHLLELEDENMQSSAHISGLEAQLRYVTDERESSLLELEKYKSVAMILQDEITGLATELEIQNICLLQKLQDVQNQSSEAQTECEYLRAGNEKLQASSESLIEECNTIQKFNGELKMKNLELHEHCSYLEHELRESHKCLFGYSKKVEALEENLASILEDFASTEKIVTSELDTLFEQSRKHKEKLDVEESLLNEMYFERTAETENLQKEVDHLTKQLSVTCDEKQRIVSETEHEISSLWNDKALLESALQEVHSKFEATEKELDAISAESALKIQDLMMELATSKRSHELLITDHRKTLKLLANYKTTEEELKATMNNLELKLTVSECDRQQLVAEIGNLRVKLEKLTHLQDEVLALMSKLDECKYEKGRLEASLRTISGDCEELRTEKILLTERISSLQKAMSEFEECKHKNFCLEEKLQQMEGYQRAKEVLYTQDAEMINELSQIKRENMQYQQKIHLLEEEKEECLKRACALEEYKKLMEEKKQVDGEKNEMQQYSKTGTAPDSLGQNSHGANYQIEGDNEHGFPDGGQHAVGVNQVAKIQLLENELAQALEANNKYKIQLQRFLCEGRNNQSVASRKSMADGEFMEKERYERSKSSLEVELRDLRERYFHMSLKYAEVEAQREDLVMKLKTAKRGKRWFS